MKILNVKGVQTISKSKQQSIFGGYESCIDLCLEKYPNMTPMSCDRYCTRIA